MTISVSPLGSTLLILTYLFILVLGDQFNFGFTPDGSDYNAYGLKVAMNELLLVQVQSTYNPPKFFVQFAPFTADKQPKQCSIHLGNLTDHYVYSVAVENNRIEFFFAGELINGRTGTFVGVGRFNASILNSQIGNTTLCSSSFSYSIEYLDGYKHDEHFRLAVQPNTHRAYGFSNRFIFTFDPNSSSRLQLWDVNATWPNLSFMPHAVDIVDQFGIIAGFIANVPNARTQFLAVIYLLRFNSSNGSPRVVAQHIPAATPNTWQDLLSNDDAQLYSAKYDMSVSINQQGGVLVGMQFINRAFLLSVDPAKPMALVYRSRFTNGRSLGYGKGVCWLNNGSLAAVLANVYTLDYQWQSSQIQFYQMQSTFYNSSSVPLSVFPNYHQTLPTTFQPIFLNIIASSMLLTLMDVAGNLLVFVPTSPGFFPAIPTRQSSLIITYSQACLPGTSKDTAGIHDCILCPTGTRNGGSANTRCIPCSPGSFCPLGASGETNFSELNSIITVVPYPKSPDTKSFGGILLNYIFGIEPDNCLLAPAMFWTLIATGTISLLTLVIYLLKYLDRRPRIKKIRETIERVLRGMDLVAEGHLWVGGLASLAMIVLFACSYVFSYQFLNLYPIEKAAPSKFACDRTPLVNALFQSTVRSLGVPQMKEEQQIIDALSQQNLTLNLHLVNTLVDCDAVAIEGLFGQTWLTLRWLTCLNQKSTLSISIPLPHQHLTVKVTLSDTKTIGALRIGLAGDENITNNYTLQALDFSQSFCKNGYLLGKTIPLSLTLTKVINETISINDGKSKYTGVFIGTFDDDLDNILLTPKEYIFSTASSIVLLLSLGESSYYEKNLQQPLAKKGDVVFQAILFSMVCLELFRLLFLALKLILEPVKDFTKSKYRPNICKSRVKMFLG